MRFTKLSSVVFLDKDIESNDVREIELFFHHNDANSLGDRLSSVGDSYSTVVLVHTEIYNFYKAELKILRAYDDYIFTLVSQYVEPVSIICFTVTNSVYERFVKNIS